MTEVVNGAVGADAEKNGAQAGGAAGTDAGASVQRQEAAGADAAGGVTFTDTAAGTKTEAVKDAGASDKAAGQSGTEGGKKTERSDAQKERDAQAARQRREREEKQRIEQARAEARAEADVKAVIEALDGKNPYTGAPMTDAADVEQYRTMKAIKARGGDPLQDYPGEVAKKTREANAERAEQEKASEWYRKDGEAFLKRYPQVDMKALTEDPDFADYAEGKVGKRPLTEIYEGYMRITGKLQGAADARAAQKLANAESGSAAAGSVAESGRMPEVTQKQFQRMNYEARAKLYRENPELYKTLVGR